MKEFLFYTTEGYTEGPNSDYPVENCQVLGRSHGHTPQEALHNLVEDNHWILKAGFSTNSIIFVELLTSEIKQDINKVVEYLWKDENKHYEENGEPLDHIFSTLCNLKKNALMI